MTTIRVDKRIARKEHKCSWCYQTIKKGEHYDSSVNVYDGSLYTWKNHFACMKIAQKLCMWDWVDNEGVTDTDFQEDICNEYRELMKEHNLEEYISDDFEMPDFKEQLIMVLNHHKIEHTL